MCRECDYKHQAQQLIVLEEEEPKPKQPEFTEINEAFIQAGLLATFTIAKQEEDPKLLLETLKASLSLLDKKKVLAKSENQVDMMTAEMVAQLMNEGI